MKKLIVCCDGTWNVPDQEEYELPAPTNVLRLYNALAAIDEAGNAQRKYYHPGVGTEGGFFAKTAGGMYGYGLGQNIMSAYAWIGRHYEAGDLIYLFGFSRGAFTVRSLAGMLGSVGILDLRRVSDPFPDEKSTPSLPMAEAWNRVEAAYDRGYRRRRSNIEDWGEADWELSAEPGAATIQFIGVWDTVGALGVPDDLALLNLLDDPKSWSFHDTRLGQATRFARHAVAMDEMRASFTPTLWTDDQGEPLHDPVVAGGPAPRARQLYFPGVHSDVGGGYYECGLAEGALRWMVEEAGAVPQGLTFDPAFVEQICPNPQAPLHNSVRGVFKMLRTRPRNLPAFSDRQRYHASALERLDRPPIFQSPYWAPARIVPAGQPPEAPIPANHIPADRVLKSAGESARCNIYAVNPWNATGLYLEAGVPYQFDAVGEWLDRNIACGPAGANDGKFQPAEILHLAGTLIGKMESLWRSVTGNQSADFKATRRVESAPWFSLIGVVANDAREDGQGFGQPRSDGTAPEHQILPIGRKLGPVILNRSGHLYAFANDAWHFYDNNRGSVTLRVRRLE